MSITTRLPIGPALAATGVVAILRGGTGRHLLSSCNALIDEGVRCLEVTTNTAGCWDVVRQLSDATGKDIEIGVGTVLTADHVRRAAESGASFIVSPNIDLEVGAAAARFGLGWYPGGATPTEIVTAWNAGATAVKVFPASNLGGPGYLRNVAAPLHFIPMVPTGGIGIDTAADYIRAGAVGVGVGGPLIGDSLVSGDLAVLRDRARRVLAAVAQGKGLPA